MGAGEYGGNGSVHWKVQQGKGREVKPNGKNSCTGVDDDAGDVGGYFNVVVEDVGATDWAYDPATKMLTGKTPIKHGAKYTRQVSVKWP